MEADQKLPFKCCKTKSTSVLVCINCGCLYHRSCLQRKIVFKKDDPRIRCCDRQSEVPSVEISEEDGSKVASGSETEDNLLKKEVEYVYLKKLLYECEEKNKVLQRNIDLLYENKSLLEEKINVLKQEVNNQVVQEISSREQKISTHPKMNEIMLEKIRDGKSKQVEVTGNKGKQSSMNEQGPVCEQKISHSTKGLLGAQKEVMNNIIHLESDLKAISSDPIVDDEGYELVGSRKKGKRSYNEVLKGDKMRRGYQNHNKRFEITTGTVVTKEDAVFRARPIKMWVYVGKVDKDVSEAVVRKYVMEKCKTTDLNDVIVRPLQSTSRSTSFQVGVHPRYYEELKLGEFWPAGVIVRRFNFRASNSGNNDQSSKSKQSPDQLNKPAGDFLGQPEK